MKKIILLAVLFIASVLAYAQPPNSFSYQAVLRNADGSIIANQQASVVVEILSGTTDGPLVFTETHSVTTTAQGIITMTIGSIEDLSVVDWAADSYYLKITVNDIVLGVTQLLSVPYALHAKTADNMDESDPVFSSWDKSTGISITESQVTDLQNYLSEESDPDFNSSVACGITANDTTNWNSKLDSYTESDPVFSTWDKSTGVIISESQVSDLQDYLIEETDPVYSSNFNIDNPQDGDLLRYNAVFEKWERFTPDYAAGTHSHANATTEIDGFMSAADKAKMEGIEVGANVNVQADWNATTGDAQIINKPTAISDFTLDGNSGQIKNIANPTDAQDAVTKAYVDELKIMLLNLQAELGVTDIEGNHYDAVRIGNQVWMAKNLRVSSFNNGMPITTGLDDATWSTTTDGAFAIYPYADITGLNSEEEVLEAYGALYNWYAVETSNLCPMGWHVPSDEEWNILIEYVGGTSIAGGKLKSTRTAPDAHPRWNSPNTGATDEYGFMALPGGSRNNSDGNFSGVDLIGFWWSSTEVDETDAYSRDLHYDSGNVGHGTCIRRTGFSVRCIKD